jgi:hypothetical protein
MHSSTRGLFCDKQWYCCNDWETPVHASYPHVHHLVYPLSAHIIEPVPYEPRDDQPFLFSKLELAPATEESKGAVDGTDRVVYNSPAARKQVEEGADYVTEPYIDTRTGNIRVSVEVLGELIDEALASRMAHLAGGET